jgi:hypothetical protein
MAGVMMPSPKSRAAPIRIMMTAAPSPRLGACSRPVERRASRAKMPPSPWLSARMTNQMYFMLTTRMSAQKISDRTPKTPAVRSTPAGRCAMHSFMV